MFGFRGGECDMDDRFVEFAYCGSRDHWAGRDPLFQMSKVKVASCEQGKPGPDRFPLLGYFTTISAE